MTQKERNEKRYKQRRENGLCVNCGKPLDREGAMCVECCALRAKQNRDRRKWYADAGICPRCGKYSLFGDEKTCPECRAKNTEARRKWVENCDKEKLYERNKISYKKRYETLKANGICPMCGKRKPEKGFVTCGICLAKSRERRREKRGTFGRDKSYERGICYFCDNPVKPGYKVCEKHYEMNIKKLQHEKCVAQTEYFKKIQDRIIKARKGAVMNGEERSADIRQVQSDD